MEFNKISSGLTVVAGLWLLVSPWVLGYAGIQTATANDVLFGVVIALLAAARTWYARGAWASWVDVVLAVWLVVSPWALAYAINGAATWNNVIVGILVGALAVRSAYTPRREVTFASAEPEDPWD